jgi:hypothetical protein
LASEIIAVRSLTDSDLGLFAAHREHARSKQRAININAMVAARILSKQLFASGGGQIPCICQFGDIRIDEPRHFGKIHRNWRLGGNKIEGAEFAYLDSKDFVLIRSVAQNDGSTPLHLSFVAKKIDRVIHAGIAAIVEQRLHQSMALYGADFGFSDLARFCAPLENDVVKPASGRIRAIKSVRP